MCPGGTLSEARENYTKGVKNMLDKLIEKYRSKLIKLSKRKRSFLDPEVLELSKKLDECLTIKSKTTKPLIANVRYKKKG